MKPLVSVVITYYMYEEFILDCIYSCGRQTYRPIEIIVVDDCSPDTMHREDSFKIGLNIAYNGIMVSGVNYIRHDVNQGFAKAKNSGIRASKGEFVTFIDADDALTPDSIERRVEAFKPDIDFIHGNVYNVTTIGPKIATYEDMLDCTKKYSKDPITLRYFKKQHRKKIHAQSQMFRRSVFERFGLYWDIKSKADKEMTYRLGLHPESPLPKLIKHKKIDDFVAFYRRKPDSMKGSLGAREKYRLKRLFDQRIEQLKEEGLTKGNTEWLK